MSSENLSKNSSLSLSESHDRHHWGIIVPVMIVGGLVLCGLIVGGLIYFASRTNLVSAAERQCHGNLRQIGQALANYHVDYGCFPPAYLADETGKPMHSWRVLILPYLGERTLYEQYRFDQSWDGPNNQALSNQRPDVYYCPEHPNTRLSHATNYMMIVGEGTISDGPGSTSLSNIHDNLATTLLVVETTQTGISWLEPDDLALASAEDPFTEFISSHHNSRNVNVLFCDGSIQAISWQYFTTTPKDLATINGFEPISLP